MNDAGPCHSANAAELPAAMMQQSVDKCMLAVAGSRMDHASWRLVEHQQVFVFKQDIQRHVFRLCNGRARLGPMDDDSFARARVMGRLDDLAVDADMTFGQEALDGAAGEARQLAAQKDIQPLKRQRFVNYKNFGAGGIQGTEAGLEAARPLAFSCSCFQERRMSRPTPTHIALSATLKAGKPSSVPPRRVR